MSKSLNNQIDISASDEDTIARVRRAVTDPQRARRQDPGRPNKCNVYSLHGFFDPDKKPQIYDQCTSAEIGCVDCKSLLADAINENFRSIREKRNQLATDPKYVQEVLEDGAERAQKIAREVLKEVQEKMGLPPRISQ